MPLTQSSTKRQQMKAAASCSILKQFICKNHILFLESIHAPCSHIDWAVVNSGFSRVLAYLTIFPFTRTLKTIGFWNLTHCPVLSALFFYTRQILTTYTEFPISVHSQSHVHWLYQHSDSFFFFFLLWCVFGFNSVNLFLNVMLLQPVSYQFHSINLWKRNAACKI